jgi:PncC family amidohydrolase
VLQQPSISLLLKPGSVDIDLDDAMTMTPDLKNIVEYLEQHQLKIATAESCTAGLIASTLAEIPGCAAWLECAFVTYSPDAKIRCLNVEKETIDRFNLTSEEVAREMAQGALAISKANVAVSDTGVAGPSNGDSEIAVGTVCFAWAFDKNGTTKTFSETRKFDGDRNTVRECAARYAICRISPYHRTLNL